MNHSYYSANRLAFGLTGLGILLCWPTLCSADEVDLLSLLRGGHRSARESIRSFSASVSIDVTFSNRPRLVLTGDYWRSLDVVRVQEKQREGTDDYLVKDSETRQVGRGVDPGSGQVRYTALRKTRTEILCVLDVWNLMMIDFRGPGGGRYDFDRFLEFAEGSPKVKRETKDGHNCIRVDLTYGSAGEQKTTFWHDVDHNYLVWKKIVSPKDSSSTFESEILEYLEPLPGVFIPVKCRRQSLRGSERESLEVITLTNVQVNREIAQNVFELPAIPSGTTLVDRIQRTSYPVDSNWNPIRAANPLPQDTNIADSERFISDYHSQSTTEPIPFSRWLILASLFVLVVACTFLLYRQYQIRSGLQRPN